MKCLCRNCGKVYNDQTSRAYWTGYCSQKCVHAKAKELGWTPNIEKMYGVSEYDKLKQNHQVGNVPVPSI